MFANWILVTSFPNLALQIASSSRLCLPAQATHCISLLSCVVPSHIPPSQQKPAIKRAHAAHAILRNRLSPRHERALLPRLSCQPACQGILQNKRAALKRPLAWCRAQAADAVTGLADQSRFSGTITRWCATNGFVAIVQAECSAQICRQLRAGFSSDGAESVFLSHRSPTAFAWRRLCCIVNGQHRHPQSTAPSATIATMTFCL